MKSRKNSKKETSQGRRKKPDLYLNGNILFKTSNEAQIGLIRKKSKNIYILHDSERKKTDFSIKLKNKKISKIKMYLILAKKKTKTKKMK